MSSRKHCVLAVIESKRTLAALSIIIVEAPLF